MSRLLAQKSWFKGFVAQKHFIQWVRQRDYGNKEKAREHYHETSHHSSITDIGQAERLPPNTRSSCKLPWHFPDEIEASAIGGSREK